MARSRTKFKVMIQGFSIEYEGDFEQGQNFGNAVGQGLAHLATLPAQFMDAQKNDAQKELIEAPTLDFGVAESEVPKISDKKTSKSSRTRTTKTEGPQGMIAKLAEEGYFNEWRTADEVRDKLATKGHTLKPAEISTPLKRLTQKEVLTRLDSETGNWKYKKV